MFVPAGVDDADPDLSPLAADLAGMPPTLILTVVVRYQGVNHGFFHKLAVFDAAAIAGDQVAGALRTALA